MNGPPSDILTGDIGSVDGEIVEGSESTINVISYDVEEYAERREEQDLLETYDVSAIAIPLKICGKEPVTVAQLQNIWIRPESEVALNNYLSECTYRVFNLASNSLVAPKVELPCENTQYNYNASKCGGVGLYGWAQHAMDILRTNYSINTKQFKYILIMLPWMSACGWAGLGQLGCGSQCLTWYNGEYGRNLKVLVHELGHNFGLHHSSTPGAEYGDSTCAMGSRGGNICYNVPQSWNLGITTPIYVLNNANIKDNTYVIESHLINTENFAKIDVDWVDNITSYFVSFRTQVSYDKNLYSTYSSKVYVHKFIRARSSGRMTLLLSTLNPGSLYEIPGTDVIVRFINILSTTKAQVQICRKSVSHSCGVISMPPPPLPVSRPSPPPPLPVSRPSPPPPLPVSRPSPPPPLPVSRPSPPPPPSPPSPSPPLPVSRPSPPSAPPDNKATQSISVRVDIHVSDSYIIGTLCPKLNEAMVISNIQFTQTTECFIGKTSTAKYFGFRVNMNSQNLFAFKVILANIPKLEKFTEAASLLCYSSVTVYEQPSNEVLFRYKAASNTCITV